MEMQLPVPASLARQGVDDKVFRKLLAWGWVNAAGISLDWTYWNELPRLRRR